MNRILWITLTGATLFLAQALADAPLKTALGLSMDQARQVDGIQKVYRLKFAAKRTEYNTEMRKLRRARLANDSQQVVELEKTTGAMHGQLRQIRMSEDEEIRRLLTPEQRRKFEDYIKLRKEMVGSSRDDRDL